MMVGDHCWHLREGPARRGQVERDPLHLAGEEHDVGEATPARHDCFHLPTCGAGNHRDWAEEAPDSVRKVAIGAPWPCPDSYLYESWVRSERLVGPTGSVAP